MKNKTLFFSALVALFTLAFNNKTIAADYLGTPYGGTPCAVPGIVEAENYDEGGEGVAYHDEDAEQHGAANGNFRPTEGVDVEATGDVSGSYNIGWSNENEWLKYTIDVKEAGDYYIAVRYGTEAGGNITISFTSGADVVTVSAPAPANGAWTHWGWVNMKVTGLKAGVQIMTVTPGANINYFSMSKQRVTGVSISETATIFVGSKQQLSATILPEDAGDKGVTWRSTNEAVATVSGDGLVTAVSVGEANIIVKTTDGDFEDICTVTTTDVSTPYGGTPWAIPGIVEAENYDNGGEGIAYHDEDAEQHGAWMNNFRPTEGVDVEPTNDATGVSNIGWTSENEWLKYTINVQNAGDYFVAVRYRNPAGGNLTISFTSGVDVVTVSAPAPANGSWGWVNMKVTGLKAGVQVMTVTPGANINFFSISQQRVTGVSIPETAMIFVGSKQQLSATLLPEDAGDKGITWRSTNEAVATVSDNGLVTAVSVGEANIIVKTTDGDFEDICTVTTSDTPVPFGGTPCAIPGTIEAENYDLGGEGIAYHDIEAAQQGVSNGNFRPTEGVDVEKTSDESGDFNIGWTSTDEWIKYSVNVAEAASYNIAVRYATAAGGSIILSFVSGLDTAKVTLVAPATASWGSFDWSYEKIQLKAGPQTMILNPGANINYITLTKDIVTDIAEPKSIIVNLYPNPVTEHLKLSVVADRIIVSDIAGKIVATILNSNDVDLTNLSSGMYFVKIGLNGQFTTEKIIKK